MVLIAAVLVGVVSVGALVSGVVSGSVQIVKLVEEENRRSTQNSRRNSDPSLDESWEADSRTESLLLKKYTDVY